jgi:hypothetical protein
MPLKLITGISDDDYLNLDDDKRKSTSTANCTIATVSVSAIAWPAVSITEILILQSRS